MKEWYCLFRGRKEGPFSITDLRRHPRFTPDTLVWKKGFPLWVKASQVPELDQIFKEERKEEKKQKTQGETRPFSGTEILTARHTPPPYWLLILIVIVLLLLFAFYVFWV